MRQSFHFQNGNFGVKSDSVLHTIPIYEREFLEVG